jgi:hypothetical protein
MEPRSVSGDALPPGCGVIEVHVRSLSQLFDSMDPSPFHEKDLDRNAEEYIVSSARELSGGAPTALVVHLDDAIPADAVDVVRAAVRVHFARRALLSRRELHQLLRRGWISLAIGLLVLAAAIAAGGLLTRNGDASPFAQLLQESLLIGGWVAMWRPMEILLYDWWGVRGMRRVYERLSGLAVQIVASGASEMPPRAVAADRSA